jgi:dihydrofolate reductase
MATDTGPKAGEVKRAHVRLVVCMSVDGRISRTPDAAPNQVAKGGWTSPEDKEHFRRELKEADVVLMGRRTYEIAPPMGKPTAVFSHYMSHSLPKKPIMKVLDGKREQLEEWLASMHNSRVLLCGGAAAYTAMMQFGLVDSLAITIEPVLLNHGPSFSLQSIFWPETSERRLTHVRTSLLNGSGTVHLEYIKNHE